MTANVYSTPTALTSRGTLSGSDKCVFKLVETITRNKRWRVVMACIDDGVPIAVPVNYRMVFTAGDDMSIIMRVRRDGLVDQPGARRSHATPTPRGGGIGIVVGVSEQGTGRRAPVERQWLAEQMLDDESSPRVGARVG